MDAAQSLESLLPSSSLPKRFESLGFESPLPLQLRALATLLKGENAVITGDAGTGKTVSYVLYCAAYCEEKPNSRSLVITPSEDKANEVVGHLSKLSVKATLVTGSQSDLGSVIVAPLGEATHLLRQKSAKDLNLGVVVLDGVVDPALPAAAADVEAFLNELKSSGVSPQIILVGRSMNFGAASLIRKLAGDPTEISASQVSGAPVEHIYYETEGDLLSKPNTLGDLVELEADSTFLVFCNSPSDADFVEVILRKRGVNSHKLIGNAPGFRVTKAMQDIRSGEARAVVVTDIAARSFDAESFDIVVNYSVPTDPEVYLHRIGNAGKSGRTRKVVSLVAPLDLANFHYVQKFVDFEFECRKGPSPSEVSGLQIKKLEKAASQANAANDPKISALLAQILESPQRDAIVAHLLQQSLNRQPASGGHERPRGGYQGDERRGGEEREGRDRGDGRRQRRGGRDRDRERDMDQEEGEGFGRGRGRGGDRGDREFTRAAPAAKLSRFYIGKGSAQGFSEQELRKTLEGVESIPADAIKRVNIRANYSFADVPEELESTVAAALGSGESGESKKVFAVKATLIPEPREQPESSSEDMNGSAGLDSEGAAQEEVAVEAEA
ncbi:MAG: DEAD/DEAH box helicase [Bdellovibrionota bacterium]|nr:MAG: DEAD/DEAH box helicase [Bdellovibrionota bacterium]